MRTLLLNLLLVFIMAPVCAQNSDTSETDEDVPVLEEEQEEPAFIVVEVMPEFPGGQDKMMKFIRDNVKYPQEAQKKEVEGRVVVTFVVEKDGSLTDVKVVRDIGFGCGEEAVRVIKRMPKWKPGTQRGKPVKVKMALPIQFKLG